MRTDAISVPAAKLYSKLEASLLGPADIAGSAKLWAKPGYRTLLRTESLLRQSVPLLILVFLLFTGAFRLNALLAERFEIIVDARSNLRIAAMFMEAEAARGPSPSQPYAAGVDLLVSVLPAELLSEGGFAVILGPDSIVKSTIPGFDHLVGTNFARAIEAEKELLMFGTQAGVQQTKYRGDPAHVAAASLGSEGETILLVQPEQGLLVEWRQKVSQNVALFALTALALLLTLYALLRQANRARHADILYAETHGRVDAALSRGHCGLWDWDIARGHMYWSRSMYQLLGLPGRDGILNYDEVADRIHPDDVDFLDIARSVASGETSGVDRAFRMRRADGSYVWVRARAEVCRDNDGEVHLVGVAIDITEQQMLAERSCLASKQLHDAIENISETFVLCDAQNHLVLCNSKYRETFGLKEEDVRLGAPLAEILKKARKPIETCSVTSPTFAEGERASETLLPDGRWLLMSERRTDDGGFVSIGTDVTQLKLQKSQLSDTERRLLSVIDDLTRAEREATKRSKELQQLNTSYAAEKERAESASRAKTSFLANMSHELRTPLNAIMGFSDMMRQGTFGPLGSEKYIEYTDDIHRSGFYLLRLIDDILDMAKIEAGRLALTRETVDVAQLVTEARRIVAVQAEEKGASVSLSLADGLKASIDRRATQQIVLNLLSNAVKFIDEGGRVEVRAREVGGRIVVSIRDDGIGIPAEALATLGRPFEQVEKELARSRNGTGLGLAIARSLVTLHGGRFRIASTFGEGTIVSFALPVTGPSVPAPDALAETKTAA